MHIRNLSSLKTLDLSYASSDGGQIILPTEALLSLSKLEDLRLDWASLQYSSNWANSICKLHNVKTLSINDIYNFDEALPACLANLTYLTFLSLDHSQFTSISPLFNIFANRTSLVYLSAAYANPYGILPTPTPAGVNFPPSLSYLDLSGNNFGGNLLRSLCSQTSLKYLDLSSNAFEGTIPSCIGNVTKLDNMRLSDNRFEGFIPPTIQNLTRLNTLLLHDNQLQGSIPSSVSLLTSLKNVDLSSNLLNGTFPLSLLKNCTALTALSLSRNSLTVISSQTWSSSMRLEILRLNSCSMKGRFPSFVRHHPSLASLTLSHNNLVGSIPSWIWKFENLQELDLSFNNLTGSIPSDIRSLKSLKILNLSKNKLHGLLPLYSLSQTLVINLSHNLFNGSLSLLGALRSPPSDTFLDKFLSINVAHNNISGLVPWAAILKLNPAILDFSGNKLQGKLTYLEKISNLVVLSLNGNHFRGPIPNLQNCSVLERLDLGNNSLHGSVPKSIGKLRMLRVLILGSNKLKGKVPQELLMPRYLQILDISSNKLSGSLPTSFGNLQTMAFPGLYINQFDEFHFGGLGVGVGDIFYNYDLNVTSEVGIDNKGFIYEYAQNGIALMKCIDVSNNQLIGDIPDEIGLLKGLIILNMSYNHFGGKILKSLANISQLDSLDLSNNYLSGEIPPELASLSMLGDLNLSCNNLTGEIPNQGHLTTFSASSFTGNPGLCGFQIDKACPHKNNSTRDLKTRHSKNDMHYLLFWLACGLSFGLGFAAVIIVMSFTAFGKKCFAIFDSIIYSMHFYILFMLARIQALF